MTTTNGYSLTALEISMVKMAADGMRAADIAKKRKRSLKTVEVQFYTIRMKTDCKSITQVVAKLLREKLIS